MESKNERIKRIFPRIIGMADELYPVYMPTDENRSGELDNTTLFRRGMNCFSFSTARLCYIAVYRKLFLTAFLILVRDRLINIDLSDINNMEVDTYGNMIRLDRLEDQSALMDTLIRKVFDAYGYRYETVSYKIEDLMTGVDDAYTVEDALETVDTNCSLTMQENDLMHIDTHFLLSQVYHTEWYGQDDIKIWRISNRWLSEILNRNYGLTVESERMVIHNTSRLDYLLFPDNVSCGVYEYGRRTGKYEFAATESAYVSVDWCGYDEYWCRLDSAFLNFGALLTIPLVDTLMDDIDLCRHP